MVVPLAGTWIETILRGAAKYVKSVVPLAGTWIETGAMAAITSPVGMSFPSRERGLKLFYMQSFI